MNQLLTQYKRVLDEISKLRALAEAEGIEYLDELQDSFTESELDELEEHPSMDFFRI